MTRTITIDPPGIGYYEDADGNVLARFDLPPGEHEVADAVANVVYVESRADLPAVPRGPSQQEALKDQWDAATTPEQKFAVLEELLF